MSSASPEFMSSDEIVRAGAGAGKTYALTHRVMDLADEHFKSTGKLPRLVVTTFTRKATQELRERLMLLVLEERPHLVDFVNSRANLVVSTIHGVMDLYLKRYGSSLCIDPGYRIIGASEASKTARQTLRKILFDEAYPQTLLESFSFNSIATLVRRIDQVLIENPQATPFTLEDFTQLFSKYATGAAAQLMETSQRIKEETTKENWLKMAETYDLLGSLLRSPSWQSVREQYLQICEDLPIARKNPKGVQPVSEETMEMAKSARALAKEFLDPVYDPAAWRLFTEQYQHIQDVAQRFAENFRKTKLDQGVLEISDLEALAMQCIRAHPETAQAFWSEWDHWLVDEYQDTSPFQVELIRQLTGERPSFIVGDPQQSIYLFRGARSEVFAERQRQIKEHGGSECLLQTNRRSRPELLLFINDLFTRFTPPFAAMQPFFKDGQGLQPNLTVAKIVIVEKEMADAEASDSESSEMFEEAGADDPEMTSLVCHVQELLEHGALPEDICILGRTNKSLHDAASALNLFHLPTHLHVSAGFYDRREIRDALAFLKFLANPHDNFNTVELLRSAWFKVPDDAFMRAIALREKKSAAKSLWSKIMAAASAESEFEAVRRLCELLRTCPEKGLTQTFKQGLIDSGFIDLAHLHDVSGRRESNLWKLLSRLQQEESKPGFNVLAFVASAVSDLRVEEGNAEGDAVAAIEPNRINLMTVHASKGLEFKHVILPRMQQRARLTTHEDFTYDERRGRWAARIPFGENRDMTKSLPEIAWLETFQAQELQEHARVLYVALTRASESLYLSWTQSPQKNSWAEMLRLDLQAGVHECSSYQYQVEVISGAGPQPLASQALQNTQVQPRGAWHQEHQPLVKGDKATSVSDLLDHQPSRVKTENRIDLTRRLKQSSQGTAVHRLMELLKYPHSTELLNKLIGRWFPGQEEKVAAAVNFVRESKKPDLAEIIANGEVEWSFAMSERGLLIEGQIDLWGRTDSGEVWIIDYKTGSPELRQKAFEQMALYALALRKSGLLRSDETLQMAAVYPFAREIYVEPEPPSERLFAVMDEVARK